MPSNNLPELDYHAAKDTYETLHLWSQIIGKIKLEKMPWINHSWHVTLLVTATGLTTGPIPHGLLTFDIELNFIDHILSIRTSQGKKKYFDLNNFSVKSCYHQVLDTLHEFDIPVSINPVPSEMQDPLPFDKCQHIITYNPDHSIALHQAMVFANNVFTRFRSEFLGKVSPVHFFWGAYDLAVTRFSGKKAPLHPGGIPNLADWITQEAYSHEVSSCGFWPGGEAFPEPAFYTYFYPGPEGFGQTTVEPEAAYYHKELGEFILSYNNVKNTENPEAYLLTFLRSTYYAGAKLAGWEIDKLAFVKPNVP